MTDDFINDSETEPQAPDVIASIYKSMSQIIEALNTDNAMLNQQIKKMRNELDFICTSFMELRAENDRLKKELDSLSNTKKYMIDTRTSLMQLLDLNIKTIKKEITKNHETLEQRIRALEVSGH